MKKLISLILILCMACMLVPAMAVDAVDVIGTWYLNEMTTNGVTVNPADMGLIMYITVNEDGTASSVNQMGDNSMEANGTWTLDGDNLMITMDESEPMALAYADGKLMLEADGQSGVFTQDEPVISEKPQVVAAESEDAFLGTWSVEAMDVMGAYVSKDMFGSMGMEGYDCTVTIESGKAIVATTMSGTTSTMEMASRFEEGKLFVDVVYDEDTIKQAESLGLTLPEMSSTIELLDNGGILYGMDMMGITMGVYMVPAEAVAEAPAA